MSDDVQQPGPDEAVRVRPFTAPDDTEGHRFRGGATPTDEENLPGPDSGRRLSITADDTDTDVEGHRGKVNI